MSLQRKRRLTMYLTMYLSKKSYIMQSIENRRTTERFRSGRTCSATSLLNKYFTMYLLCTNYVPPPLNRRSTKTQNNMDTLLKGSHRSIESFYFTKNLRVFFRKNLRGYFSHIKRFPEDLRHL